MKSLYNIMSAFLALTLTTPSLIAEEQAPIVTSITEDSANVVVIPDKLMDRLMPHEDDNKGHQENHNRSKTHMAGYRVQVFSDNNARTAKNEARRREQTVASRFPQYRTYKRYTAPFWRLRVGDFKTQREAEAAAADMRRSFPSFGKEIRVVRDRIFITE